MTLLMLAYNDFVTVWRLLFFVDLNAFLSAVLLRWGCVSSSWPWLT